MNKITQCNWCFDISTKDEHGKTCKQCHLGTMLETDEPVFRRMAAPYKSRFVRWIMDDRPPSLGEKLLVTACLLLWLVAIFGD